MIMKPLMNARLAGMPRGVRQHSYVHMRSTFGEDGTRPSSLLAFPLLLVELVSCAHKGRLALPLPLGNTCTWRRVAAHACVRRACPRYARAHGCLHVRQCLHVGRAHACAGAHAHTFLANPHALALAVLLAAAPAAALHVHLHGVPSCLCPPSPAFACSLHLHAHGRSLMHGRRGRQRGLHGRAPPRLRFIHPFAAQVGAPLGVQLPLRVAARPLCHLGQSQLWPELQPQSENSRTACTQRTI